MATKFPVPGTELTATDSRSVAIPETYTRGVDLNGYQRLTHDAVTAYGHELTVTTIALKHKKTLKNVISRVFGCGIEGVEVGEVRIGDHMTPLLLPAKAEVEFKDFDHEDENGVEMKERDKFAMQAYHPVLKLLAQLSGSRVWLHGRGGAKNIASFRAEPNIIHLVSNACPPGPSTERDVRAICGHLLHPEAGDWLCQGPTTGRGLIVKDRRGNAAVQILNTTWYLLVPVFAPYNGETSVDILTELLILGWKGARQTFPDAAPLSRADFSSELYGWRSPSEEYYRKEIEKVEKKIGELQRELAEYQGKLRRFNALYECWKSNGITLAAARLGPISYDNIINDGRVASITRESYGLHFHTTPVVIQHDGARYDIGPVTIRVNESSEIYVWTDEPRHPEGIVHPHVGRDGSPCLGNATSAILDAIVEDRLDDAVLFLLAWLFDGYTPALAAIHKIEEWPLITPNIGATHG